MKIPNMSLTITDNVLLCENNFFISIIYPELNYQKFHYNI